MSPEEMLAEQLRLLTEQNAWLKWYVIATALIVVAPRVTYTVVLRLDPAGACPVLLDEDSDPLPGGDDVRYGLVAEDLDFEEAARLVVQLRETPAGGGLEDAARGRQGTEDRKLCQTH